MDSRKIISREPLFEIILLNIERKWFEEKFQRRSTLLFFHRCEKRRESSSNDYWLTRGSLRNPIFFINDRKKSTREENEDRSTPLLFFSFFSFFHPTNRSSHPRREGNIFPIRVELEPLFIDEKIPREASVDKRRDSFLLKGGHNGTADKSSRN